MLVMVCRAIDCGGNWIANTIIVDQHKKGSFVTIQAAIDSINNQNKNWVMINISPGIYNEKVHIPFEKPCIILKGWGRNATTITYNDSFQNMGTSLSASFISSPPNVVVSGITFKNTYGSNGPAVAVNIYGDKSALYECSFIGYQDTLLITSGRSYFKNCFIQGEVDFICGEGQSYFENCVINAVQEKGKPIGFVTAQHRNSPKDSNGFVFRGGSVVGTGNVNLGRPWGPYARVIFWETYFSSVVTPQGWDIWNLKPTQE
ncbi:probable pectinesterase 29 [Cicer arietinum]